ncbi:redoxin domain-containing protein [Halalkalicoccus sp. NIPERK01]|uniref:TlpA family protein disulfide reductase n=1 Tax=Halalkalicoccus sp. NIPERK01 TaxID=3053469 RepID=UPI00256F634F|nr:redoxin domain-containing protein [Halalkalicoccus sp. NIPERK01]MDL5361030.1 redoxin domain-containing protein [Halalkalicoccus sp. NIPERK01]
MIQLSGGIALASMAGCLGSDDDPKDTDEKNDPDDGENTKDGGENDKPKSGDDAPKVDVETHDGKTVTVEARDKPTIVMFADIESEECKSYSKTLVDLHEEYHDRAYVVTINSNLDVSKEDLKAFHEEYGGDWDHAMGHAKALEKYGIEASVTICVIDEHGKIAFRIDGEIDRETVEKLLEAYANGEIDQKDIEEVIEAYRKGEIDEKDVEEAIETYADD